VQQVYMIDGLGFGGYFTVHLVHLFTGSLVHWWDSSTGKCLLF